MAGGDAHIRVQSGDVTKFVIDASTKNVPDMNMTTPVKVGRKTVYMTAKGAARLKSLLADGTYSAAVYKDTRAQYSPDGLFDCQVRNIPDGFTEECRGKINRDS